MPSQQAQDTKFKQKDASDLEDLADQLVEQAEITHTKKGSKEGPVSINRTLQGSEKELLEGMMRNEGALTIDGLTQVLQTTCRVSMAASGALSHFETPRLKILIKRRKNHLHRIALTIT